MCVGIAEILPAAAPDMANVPPPEAFLVGGVGWITRDGHKIRMRIVEREDSPDGALRMVMETDAGERYTLVREKLPPADVTRVTRVGIIPDA